MVNKLSEVEELAEKTPLKKIRESCQKTWTKNL